MTALGILARADDKGLAVQSWEFSRHLRPDRVAVVDCGSPLHLERFPGATLWRLDSPPSRSEMRRFLRGLDVLWTAETPYFLELLELARAEGVRTFVHGNYEFLRWLRAPRLPRPDVFLAPSSWNLDRWPAGTVLLPWPVATDRIPWRSRALARVFVHPAGTRAIHDRNGTLTVLEAARYVEHPEVRIVVRAQGPQLGRAVSRIKARRLEVDERARPDYWTVLDAADVVVLPRRFGGQCLPANEAIASGAPVLMPAIEPQTSELPPAWLLPARQRTTIAAPVGRLPLYEVDPRQLARAIDEWADDPARIGEASAWCRAWTESRSWSAMLPRYRAALGLG